MRPFRLYLLLVLLSDPARTFAAAPLGIKDVLSAAIIQNETAEIKSAALQQTKAQLSQAKSTSLPQVNVMANITKEDESSHSSARESTQKSARLNVSQPLLSLLRDYDLVAAADARVSAAGHEINASLLDLQVAANKAFHAVLAASRDISNLVKLRDTTSKRVIELTSRVRIGRSRPADLYTAQAQLAANDAQLEGAKAAEAAARNDLSQTTGLPEDTELKDDFDAPADVGALTSYLQKIEDLPSIKALKAALQASTLQVRAARLSHLPKLDLFGNYYLYREKPLDDVKWDVGLQLTLPLYEGGIVNAKVMEAASTQRETEVLLVQKRRLLELSVREAYDSVSAGLRQISFLKKSLDLAEKSYRQIAEDYELGLSTNLEVIQAFNSVAEARRQFDKQVVAAKSAYVTLILTSGQTL